LIDIAQIDITATMLGFQLGEFLGLLGVFLGFWLLPRTTAHTSPAHLLSVQDA
jgi:hypothetical protein